MTSGQEHIDTDALRGLAGRFDSEIGKHLEDGQLMGTPLDSGKGLAEGALITASAAACVIPDAWAFVSQTYVAQCDPGAIFAAGEAWLKAAGDLGDAVSAAENVNNSVGGTGWQGSDYTAYCEKVADYIRQMMVAQIFAVTVGIALIAVAIM